MCLCEQVRRRCGIGAEVDLDVSHGEGEKDGQTLDSAVGGLDHVKKVKHTNKPRYYQTYMFFTYLIM